MRREINAEAQRTQSSAWIEERFLTSTGRRFSDRIGIFDRRSESGRKNLPASFGMTEQEQIAEEQALAR